MARTEKRSKGSSTVETRTAEEMAVVDRMLAHAAREKDRPVVERGGRTSAFDHPTNAGRGSIANSSDRVTLCPETKPCRICQARAAAR